MPKNTAFFEDFHFHKRKKNNTDAINIYQRMMIAMQKNQQSNEDDRT